MSECKGNGKERQELDKLDQVIDIILEGYPGFARF